MAELASGAVSSLLGLLRNEALLLSRVGSDVEFIKEEMESMHSFLEHLARTAPPVGGHDEQVRTWMKQVQDLAHDCSNCIDLYLRLGDHAVFRARAGRWRHLWWASWLLRRMLAQHKAAIRLRELKERARDVGQRRMRYGVEIPGKELGGSASTPAAAVADDDEDDGEDDDVQDQVAATSDVDDSDSLEPHVLQEYFANKLDRRLQAKVKEGESSIASIAIVTPNVGTIVEGLMMVNPGFQKKVEIHLPAVHFSWDRPLLSSEILSYILLECELQNNTLQLQRKVEEQDIRRQAFTYKNKLRYDFWITVYQESNVHVLAKIEEIKSQIIGADLKKKHVGEGKNSFKTLSDKRLAILLQALQLVQADVRVTDTDELSTEEALEQIATMLKKHMEAGKSEIRLQECQYQYILKKVFPESETPQPQSAASTGGATLGEDRVKEIIHNHKITLDIILGLLPKPQLLEGTSAREQATGVAAVPVIKRDKEEAKETTNEVIRVTDAASVIKEIKEEKDEISMEVTSWDIPIASITNEANEKMEISGEVTRDIIPATVVKETKEKLKELCTDVINETKQKMKEISGEVTSAIVADVIKEAKEKMKDISEEAEATSDFASARKETMKKMYQIQWEIWDHLFIQGIVDKVQKHLKDKKTLIVLQDDEDYISKWEETRNALNLLQCHAGSAVIVSTKNSKKAKEFCNPKEDPITCSLVGFYHDKVLRFTQQSEKISQILYDILDRCHPHEFCMKIFVGALYANPKRSYEDLQKLREDLIPQMTLGGNAKKMLKFSYKDLPREYKTCLLYLAIFPQRHSIRRSTLIGRWVTEGLITKEDWCTAVRHAEQCFDALIKRGLILPHDIGAAGKVKSCMVDDQVHGFITKIANKQHILDARMSDLWARHFSVFSGLRLRTSDGIDKFVHKLPKYSPQLPLLKVLDLEGTQCFEKSHYLKDICNKILLLKYLSLRRSNVSHIPSEINKLHELEVLDIRETMVPEHATGHILLLKLRRFMANRVTDRIMDGKSGRLAVQIPWKIEKMENLEVLSNVRASQDGSELKNIRHLWQLRKLGVVIQDKKEHLDNFLRAVSDLKDRLRSLSVTICDTRSKSTPSSEDEQQNNMDNSSRQPPKHLESLTINGVSKSDQLLGFLARGSEELAMVTLGGTLLKQENLGILAMLPRLRCVRLQYGAYNDSKLIFKEEDFSHLKYFLVEGTSREGRKESMAKIDVKFDYGATAELEKIVLSFSGIRSLGGIDDLPKLKDLELEGNEFLHSFSQDREASKQNPESEASKQNPESEDPEESRLTFKKEKFKNLKYFRVESSKMTNIVFEDGAAPELKKIVLSLTNTKSKLTGVKDLRKLKEIELKGDNFNFLISLFDDAHQIAKLSLRETHLKQEDIQVLAKKTNLHCLVLSEESYNGSQLSFNKDDFLNLELLIVECPNINVIKFTNGSAPKLEKIVWTFSEMKSLSGISHLLKLKEIECSGDLIPYQVRKDIAVHAGKPVLKLHQTSKATEKSTAEEDGDTWFSPISRFLKIKN